MQYAIHHITQFDYEAPISESIMEVRMRPRTDERQQCYSFDLEVSPPAPVFSHLDYMGNTVHHFNIPEPHDALRLDAHALVEVKPMPDWPDTMPTATWARIDRLLEDGEHFEMILPSAFARPTALLGQLSEEIGIQRRDDPLGLLRELNTALYQAFEYKPLSTHANSPIDEALHNRAGVCQDFAHIFIALVRSLRIPCRYVSGYLHHRTGGDNGHDRSAEDGSHAWAEAYLPELGWVGFDPTNDILAGERHIRVALGRDYADVAPNRGVYKGTARSNLHVGVSVAPAEEPALADVMPELAFVLQELTDQAPAPIVIQSQQQQQ